MVKYFHELTEQEFEEKCIGKKWSDIAKKFPGPPWCEEQYFVVDSLGCWSLISFKDGHSMVTEDFCKGCNLYKPHSKS